MFTSAVPERPLVSVLIANYNYARFLGAAIDSVLGQTYPNIEVVVVDDGSTDDSTEVMRSFHDRIRPLYFENAGQAAAVNAGLAKVTGAVTMLLDADDGLEPDVVERVVEAFRANPALVRVQFRLAVFDDDGRPTGRMVPPQRWELLTGDLSHYVMRWRMFRSPPSTGNAWSTAALRELPPAPESLRTFVDRWWSELTALLGPVGALDAPGGFYRVHEASLHAREGIGEQFLRTRAELTELLHAAGAELAARHGIAGYPASVDDPLDAPYMSRRIALQKLGIRPPERPLWQLAWRGTLAALLQPGQPLRSRLGRAVWMLALAAAPARRGGVERVLALRYARGEQ